ncbi:uncharacterized protein V1513DRAFT_438289 [Lipomyces chichibuensis]|uniref:uncharacterized protein n=1 Tax=Lipomyces chichibuensis TaxID=1546026 RepID=UPI00334334EF
MDKPFDWPKYLVAIHDFNRRTVDELTLRKGDRIEVLETDDGFSDGWYMGQNLVTNRTGLFPYVYTAVISSSEYASPQASLEQAGSTPPSSDEDGMVSEKHASIYEAFNDIEHALSGLGPPSVTSNEATMSSVLSWTPLDVSQYLAQEGFEPDVCEKFVEHKITGKIFLELELPLLKELDIASFGTRFELNKVIEKLRKSAESATRSSPRATSYGQANRQKHQSVQPLDPDNRSRLSVRVPAHTRQRSRSLDIPQENRHKSGIPSFDRNWQLPQSPKLAQSPPQLAMSPLGSVQGLEPAAAEPINYRSEYGSQYVVADMPDTQEGFQSPILDSAAAKTQKQTASTSALDSQRSYDDESKSRTNSQYQSMKQTIDAPTSEHEQESLLQGYRNSSTTSAITDNAYDSPISSAYTSPTVAQSEIHPRQSLMVAHKIISHISSDLSGMERDNLDSFKLKGRTADRSGPGQTSPKRTITEPLNGTLTAQFFGQSDTVTVTNTDTPRSVSSTSYKPKKLTKQNTSAFTEGRQKITPDQSAASGEYSGWMSKRGGSGVGAWKTRFFVLHGTRLSYFASSADQKEKGLIDITAHRVVPIKANEDKLVALYAASTGSGRYCFKLVPPAPGSRKGVTFTAPRVHYFAIDNREDMRGWMNALMKATIDRDDSVPVISSCTTPTVSLSKARELNALAMEARAEELRMSLTGASSESSSTVSTPELSVSKESDNSEHVDSAFNFENMKQLSLEENKTLS